jgi:hypothetical protein
MVLPASIRLLGPIVSYKETSFITLAPALIYYLSLSNPAIRLFHISIKSKVYWIFDKLKKFESNLLQNSPELLAAKFSNKHPF